MSIETFPPHFLSLWHTHTHAHYASKIKPADKLSKVTTIKGYILVMRSKCSWLTHKTLSWCNGSITPEPSLCVRVRASVYVCVRVCVCICACMHWCVFVYFASWVNKKSFKLQLDIKHQQHIVLQELSFQQPLQSLNPHYWWLFITNLMSKH